jgi:hypothetical protein
VKIEDIVKKVPWKLKISDNLTETAPPTAQEIDFIRNIAPAQAAGRKIANELIIRNARNANAQGKPS